LRNRPEQAPDAPALGKMLVDNELRAAFCQPNPAPPSLGRRQIKWHLNEVVSILLG
jgi:hypothetical protein